MNLYLSDGEAKLWRKKGTANDPKHSASSVKHGGGVMAWACMAASGTASLNFTDDLMYDNSSRINLEEYKTILPTNIQENAIIFFGKCFILHQNNDPEHPASSVKEFIRAKKWKVFDCPSQSPDLNPSEEESQGRNSPKQGTLGIGCIKGWEKYFKGWDQESGEVYGSWTHCCDCAQGDPQLNNSF